MPKHTKIFYALCVFITAQFCMAEDIEDIDFELEFSRQQKSTLENFPLQAIDQETRRR